MYYVCEIAMTGSLKLCLIAHDDAKIILNYSGHKIILQLT